MTRRFLAWIQFQGTHFCGYAKQSEQRSVAGTLEKAWLAWRDEQIHVMSSSRTDSGVHARRMPIYLATRSKVPSKAVVFGWNHHLPLDVAILSAEPVDQDFHVRHDAVGKRYIYRIWNGRVRQPFRRLDHWHVTRPLDAHAMQQAAPAFMGSHNYDAFRSVHCQSLSTRRSIRLVDVEREGDLVTITVEGNAFLHNMVRIMVGTLVDVGWGRIAPGELSGIIASKKRANAGQTAPAVGLTLDDVFYGPFGAKEGLNYKKLDGQYVEPPPNQATDQPSATTDDGGT